MLLVLQYKKTKYLIGDALFIKKLANKLHYLLFNAKQFILPQTIYHDSMVDYIYITKPRLALADTPFHYFAYLKQIKNKSCKILLF